MSVKQKSWIEKYWKTVVIAELCLVAGMVISTVMVMESPTLPLLMEYLTCSELTEIYTPEDEWEFSDSFGFGISNTPVGWHTNSIVGEAIEARC